MAKKSIFDDIPTPVLVVGTGVGLYALYRLFVKSSVDSLSDKIITMPPQSALSYPANYYATLADGIYQAFRVAGFGSFTEDDQAVGNALMTMNNDADVEALVYNYGEREGTLLTTDKNLWEAIEAWLDQDVIDQVNANWQSKGITFVLV